MNPAERDNWSLAHQLTEIALNAQLTAQEKVEVREAVHRLREMPDFTGLPEGVLKGWCDPDELRWYGDRDFESVHVYAVKPASGKPVPVVLQTRNDDRALVCEWSDECGEEAEAVGRVFCAEHHDEVTKYAETLNNAWAGESFIDYVRRHEPDVYRLDYREPGGEWITDGVAAPEVAESWRDDPFLPDDVECRIVPLYDIEDLYRRYRNAEAEWDMNSEEVL